MLALLDSSAVGRSHIDAALFTISSYELHLDGVFSKLKKEGSAIMTVLIEVFILVLAAIFGVLYTMLQLANR